jgi:hypothetical protein
MQNSHSPQTPEHQQVLGWPRPRSRKKIFLLVAAGLVAVFLCLYFFGAWETAHPGPSRNAWEAAKSFISSFVAYKYDEKTGYIYTSARFPFWGGWFGVRKLGETSQGNAFYTVSSFVVAQDPSGNWKRSRFSIDIVDNGDSWQLSGIPEFDPPWW